jgi:hypothetical protein
MEGVPSPMNKTRPNKVIFRMSDQELELLNQRVKESGMTKQDWILSATSPYLNGAITMNNDESLLWRVDKKTMDFLRKHINEFKIQDDEDRELSEQVLDDIQILAMALDGLSKKREK